MKALIILAILLSFPCCRGSLETGTPPPGTEGHLTPTDSSQTSTSRGASHPQPSRGRIATPPWIPCEASHADGYVGQVVRYVRREGELEIEIHTDWETFETVTMSLDDSHPERSFRLHGEPFGEGDWRRIESAAGRMVPELRAQAWVCRTEGHPTIIDWRPGDAKPSNPY